MESRYRRIEKAEGIRSWLTFLLLQSTHPATDPEMMPSDAPTAELEPGLTVLPGEMSNASTNGVSPDITKIPGKFIPFL